MIINICMSINFTANQVHQTTIPRKLSWRNYADSAISIVELDSKNDADIDAIIKTERNWTNNGGQYIHHFCRDFVENHRYVDIEKEHYYALTTQNADFNKLNPKNILGVLMFSESKNFENEITWLEVDPATRKSAGRNREYKEVGKRLVEYILNKYKEKDIFVQSAKDAIKFYKKLGAEQPYQRFPKKCQLYFRV